MEYIFHTLIGITILVMGIFGTMAGVSIIYWICVKKDYNEEPVIYVFAMGLSVIFTLLSICLAFLGLFPLTGNIE